MPKLYSAKEVIKASKKEIAKGTFSSILVQANMTRKEFEEFYQK